MQHQAESNQGAAQDDGPYAMLPLFRPGVQVIYDGQLCTVDHILIHHYDLLIHLKELNVTVDSTKVSLAPTRIRLKRS